MPFDHFHFSEGIFPLWRDASFSLDVSLKDTDEFIWFHTFEGDAKAEHDNNRSLQVPFFLAVTTNEGDNENDPCSGSDWIFLVVHTFSWSLRWICWKPFFLWYTKHVTPRKRLPTDVANFSQCMTACLFHCLSGYFSFKILAGKDWLFDQNEWFRMKLTMDPDFKFYYLLYAALYISDLISLCFEPTRSDTWAYAVHHLVTVAVVLGSAQAGYTQAGAVIMFTFDWADPFLLAGKAFKYISRHESDWYQFMTDRLFELFACVFFLTRNVFFNYILYVYFTEYAYGEQESTSSAKTSLSSMLVILAFLMTYWLAIILLAAMNYQDKGNVDDIRE